MAGNDFDLATRNRTLHVAAVFGATNLLPLIVHAPVSDHVLRPGDTDFTMVDNVVCERRLTVVLRTVNPGRAT